MKNGQDLGFEKEHGCDVLSRVGQEMTLLRKLLFLPACARANTFHKFCGQDRKKPCHSRTFRTIKRWGTRCRHCFIHGFVGAVKMKIHIQASAAVVEDESPAKLHASSEGSPGAIP